jgi:hypothetical protein
MITVKYERYWNDYLRRFETKSFYSLSELENWMFDSIKRSYKNALRFPTSEPCRIEVAPSPTSELIWIHLIETDGGIIFSDGEMTDKHKHWSEEVKKWLMHCEERKNKPKFNFVD